MSAPGELPPQPDSASPHHAPETSGSPAEGVPEHEVARRGLRQIVAELRVKRAQDTIERMEHKDELYSAIGELATRSVEQRKQDARHGRNAELELPRSQSLPEKIKTKRMMKKKAKRDTKAIYAYRARMIHGEDLTDQAPSVRKAITDATLHHTVGTPKPETSVRESIAKNAKQVIFQSPDVSIRSVTPEEKRLFSGSNALSVSESRPDELKGMTKWGRRWKRLVNTSEWLFGDTTSAEYRLRAQTLKSIPGHRSNQVHRWSRRNLRRTEETLGYAIQQPVMSRWRKMRLKRGEKRLAKNEARLELAVQKAVAKQERKMVAKKGRADARRAIAEDLQESWATTKDGVRQAGHKAKAGLKTTWQKRRERRKSDDESNE